MRVVETIYKGNDWRSGEEDVDRQVEVSLVDDYDKKVAGVSFSEGEPEDMTLHHDLLSDAYGILGLVEHVYELGLAGVEVTFNCDEEEYSKGDE